jgi:hypothetical protein
MKNLFLSSLAVGLNLAWPTSQPSQPTLPFFLTAWTSALARGPVRPMASQPFPIPDPGYSGSRQAQPTELRGANLAAALCLCCCHAAHYRLAPPACRSRLELFLLLAKLKKMDWRIQEDFIPNFNQHENHPNPKQNPFLVQIRSR